MLEVFRQRFEDHLANQAKAATESQKQVKEVIPTAPVETAMFKYAVLDGDVDHPMLDIEVTEYDENSLNCLAKMLATMNHKHFIFYILTYLEKGFIDNDKYNEFIYLLHMFDEMKKELGGGSDEPYIKPSELLGD